MMFRMFTAANAGDVATNSVQKFGSSEVYKESTRAHVHVPSVLDNGNLVWMGIEWNECDEQIL